MGRRIGYKDVLSMIKVGRNEVKIQCGGRIFVCEKHFNPFDGDRIALSLRSLLTFHT